MSTSNTKIDTNNFSAVVSQPTVKDGSLKKSLDLTRLALDENLHVSTENGQIVVNDVNVPLTVAIAAALLPAYQTDARQTLPQLLEQYSLGYVNNLQRLVAESDTTGGKKPTGLAHPKSVLTAIEYKANCLALGRDKFGPVQVDQLFAIDLQKATKADLAAYLQGLRDIFFTEEQQQTFAHMVEEEEKQAKQFEGLTQAGFADIKRLNETDYAATIAASVAATAIPKLAELGYTLKKSDMHMETFVLSIVFAETVTEEKIV